VSGAPRGGGAVQTVAFKAGAGVLDMTAGEIGGGARNETDSIEGAIANGVWTGNTVAGGSSGRLPNFFIA
jgi:hypothetical protein